MDTYNNDIIPNDCSMFWDNISCDIYSLTNIKYPVFNHSFNYDLFKNFPLNEIKTNLANNNYDIESIFISYMEQHKIMHLIDANFFKLLNIKTIFDFYNDLNKLNKLNSACSFIDINDKKKIIFTVVIFIAICVSSITINNNQNDLKTTYDNNPLILFYISSYLFFDYLFDDITINKNIKKNIVKYVNNIFDNGPNLDFSIPNDKYFDTINNLFMILQCYDKSKYPLLYQTLKNVFNIEATTSKIQTYYENYNVDLDKILLCTLLKGRETINGVWQICDIDKDFKQDIKYNKLMNHFGLIFQMLDDLIDIEQDINENNITIFSYPFIYKIENPKEYLEKNIIKLTNYVYLFRNIQDEIDINFSEKQKEMLFNMLLLMLNYGISKNDILKKILADHQHLFFFKFDDIIKFRQFKYEIF